MSWVMPSLASCLAATQAKSKASSKSAAKSSVSVKSSQVSKTPLFEDPLTKRKREELETKKQQVQVKLKIAGRDLYSSDDSVQIKAAQYLEQIREINDELEKLRQKSTYIPPTKVPTSKPNPIPTPKVAPFLQKAAERAEASRIPLANPSTAVRGEKKKELQQRMKDEELFRQMEEQKRKQIQNEDAELLKKLRGREVRRHLNAMARGQKYDPLPIEVLKKEVEEIKANKLAGKSDPNETKNSKKPRRDEDHEDEEEDEYEMDDWLVDDEEEEDTSGGDWRRELRKITGYDPKKYANMPIEEVEEASYGDQLREEARSRKIARMDEKRLEEEEMREKIERRKMRKYE